MTAYFVTGATGFIGRHLVERLLEREGDIYVLVREGSREKLDALIEGWGQPTGSSRSSATSASARSASTRRAHGRRSTTSSTSPRSTTWARTRPATRCSTSAAPRTRSTSPTRSTSARSTTCPRSPSPASTTRARSTRTCSTRARSWPTRTTARSSSPRSSCASASRRRGAIYRPSVVVGDSRTGEMDKIDGPYYFFKLIQKVRHTLPEWFPLISLEWGWTNIVPVDYVAAAVDHIAHQAGPRRPDLPRRRPQGPARRRGPEHVRGGRPRAQGRDADRPARDRRTCPRACSASRSSCPRSSRSARNILADLGIPDEVVEYIALSCRFDARDTQRALRDSDITLPPLASYAEKLWDYWERTLDPDLYKDRSFEGAVNGKTVVITGASSGIGRAAALKIAAAGGIPILVARTKEKLDEVKAEIEAAGGTAYVAPCDLSDFDAIDEARRDAARRPRADRHARQQRGTLDPAHRSRSPTTASTTTSARSTSTTSRPCKLMLGAAAAHARPGRRPHRQRVARSACRPTRRASAPTWAPRPRWTRSRAW